MRVEVLLEDQQRINTFSRLNARVHDFEAQVKAKKVRMCQSPHAGGSI